MAFGCGRCRYSAAGCSTCRNASYSPTKACLERRAAAAGKPVPRATPAKPAARPASAVKQPKAASQAARAQLADRSAADAAAAAGKPVPRATPAKPAARPASAVKQPKAASQAARAQLADRSAADAAAAPLPAAFAPAAVAAALVAADQSANARAAAVAPAAAPAAQQPADDAADSDSDSSSGFENARDVDPADLELARMDAEQLATMVRYTYCSGASPTKAAKSLASMRASVEALGRQLGNEWLCTISELGSLVQVSYNHLEKGTGRRSRGCHTAAEVVAVLDELEAAGAGAAPAPPADREVEFGMQMAAQLQGTGAAPASAQPSPSLPSQLPGGGSSGTGDGPPTEGHKSADTAEHTATGAAPKAPAKQQPAGGSTAAGKKAGADAEADAPVKRKPGRPRKAQPVGDAQQQGAAAGKQEAEAEPDSAAGQPAKRKPGCPRKSPSKSPPAAAAGQQDAPGEQAAGAPAPPKRKRGRPSKAELAARAAAQAAQAEAAADAEPPAPGSKRQKVADAAGANGPTSRSGAAPPPVQPGLLLPSAGASGSTFTPASGLDEPLPGQAAREATSPITAPAAAGAAADAYDFAPRDDAAAPAGQPSGAVGDEKRGKAAGSPSRSRSGKGAAVADAAADAGGKQGARSPSAPPGSPYAKRTRFSMMSTEPSPKLPSPAADNDADELPAGSKPMAAAAAAAAQNCGLAPAAAAAAEAAEESLGGGFSGASVSDLSGGSTTPLRGDSSAVAGAAAAAGATFLSKLQERMQQVRTERAVAASPSKATSALSSGRASRGRRMSQAGGLTAAGDPRVAVWEPPASPFGLIEEQLYPDPWKLLLACLLLNKTTAQAVRKVIWSLFKLCPTPEAAATADMRQISAIIGCLGFYKRAAAVQRFSRDYIEKQWCNPEELYGIGKYGADAYFMFCRGEWRRVQPKDKDLLKYKIWLEQTDGQGQGLTRDPLPEEELAQADVAAAGTAADAPGQANGGGVAAATQAAAAAAAGGVVDLAATQLQPAQRAETGPAE